MTTRADPRTTRILSALDRAKKRIDALEAGNREPIAVIGLGCRFPGGADSPEKFWTLLQAGFDGTGEVPRDRWRWETYYSDDKNRAGTSYANRGGFLARIDTFDAAFFGISPREAEKLDPQQRLLLEIAWEALENSAIAADTLRETKTGVFVGMSTDDYAAITVHESGSFDELDMYASLGNSRSVAAGRVASFLGLQGPVVQLDTACSSSLVAVHLACRSLQQRDCDVALAGGVNVIASPLSMISRSRMQALSRDGRCKTFDANADGYGQGEGCGIVVLKRLSQAEADGDEISAVILGSATNHNGPSSGITVPNENAQRAVIEAAIEDARIVKSDIEYIEAHGTGTVVGDPLEINGLVQVFGGVKSKADPLFIGSVKSNIGHLEAAAGAACLIKTILAVRNAQIPAHIGMRSPNPAIDWGQIPVEVVVSARAWDTKRERRIAGVSSFGISGSNAHIVVGSYSRAASGVEDTSGPVYPILVPLSASSKKSCRDVAERLSAYVEGVRSDSGIAKIAATLSHGRAHLSARAAIVAKSKDDLLVKLQKCASAEDSIEVSREADDPVFLFTGQGSQYSGMGRDLYESQEVFREVIDACEKTLQEELPISLTKVLFQSEYAELLNQTQYTQPALFSVEYALAKLFIHWGIQPGAVAGHSVGEYVAATIAGVFSFESAIRLLALRARLMQSLPTGGGMVAVACNSDSLKDILARLDVASSISVAAINGPNSIVISGLRTSLAKAIELFREHAIVSKELEVSHAFHSELMDPILGTFAEAAKQVNYCAPTIAIASNRTGLIHHDALFTPEYWVNHLRECVLFDRGVRSLIDAGHRTYLEIGPRPILLALARETVGSLGTVEKSSFRWIPTLRPGASAVEQSLSALGTCYTNGSAINWRNVVPLSERDTNVPTYPWDRIRYWFTPRPRENTSLVKIIERFGDRLTNAQLDGVLALQRLVEEEGDATLRARWKDTAYQASFMPITLRQERTACSSVATIIVGVTGVADILGHASLSSRICVIDLARKNSVPLQEQIRAFVESFEAGTSVRVHYLATSETEDEFSERIDLSSHLKAVRYLVKTLSHIQSGKRYSLSLLIDDGGDEVFVGSLEALGRSIALEHPELWHSSIAFDSTKVTLSYALMKLGICQRHDALRVEGETVKALRLLPYLEKGFGGVHRRFSCDPRKSYLVTGGAGALGKAVCSWLNERGAKSIVVVGRREFSLVRESLPAGVEYVQCDVSEESDVAQLRKLFGAAYPQLGGIWHLSGVAAQSDFANISNTEIDAIVSSKLTSAKLLSNVTENDELDSFVFFSSLASVVGARGHTVYAATNGGLDGLALELRKRGRNALSISFGPWQNGIFGDPLILEALSRQGIAPLSPSEGLSMLDELLFDSVGRAVVAKIDWDLFRDVYEVQGAKPVLELLHRSPGTAAGVDSRKTFVFSKDSLSRQKEISDIVSLEIAQVLRLSSANDVDRDLGFFDMGMDSLLAVELKERIAAVVGLELPRTSVFNFPTVNKLSVHLAELLGPREVETLRAPKEVLLKPHVEVDRDVTSVQNLSFAELEALINSEFTRTVGK